MALFVLDDDPEKAESCLRRALKKDPKLAGAAYHLAELLAETDPKEAQDWYGKAVQLDPEDLRFKCGLASFLYGQKEIQRATEILWALLDRNPSQGEAIALLGRIYEETGRVREAIELYWSAGEREGVPQELRSFFSAQAAALEGD
jgi:cytochrome c-type biogenesis protein CcmH/NrfG